jgi:hypothetical protein
MSLTARSAKGGEAANPRRGVTLQDPPGSTISGRPDPGHLGFDNIIGPAPPPSRGEGRMFFYINSGWGSVVVVDGEM